MFNLSEFTGKVFLVTGASSGIGRSLSILLSKFGAKVVISGRDVKRLKETLSLLEGSGHNIKSGDFLEDIDFSDWIKDIVQEVGVLNGLAHCAGISMTESLRFVSKTNIEQIFTTNLKSAVLLSKAFRQKGVNRPNSSIVFVSSIVGLVGEQGLSVYAASKGGLIALTKSLSIELAREKIRVNCVAPGVVMTPMMEKEFAKVFTEEQKHELISRYPLGLGEPSDVASAIAFLLSDAARWITGTCLVVDGGYTAK